LQDSSPKDRGTSFDGIKEYTNEIPLSFNLIFIASMIWGMLYMIVLYPLGEYSQIGEYNEEVEKANERFVQVNVENMSDTDLVDMGQSLFITKCATCHGLSADGSEKHAANLTHRISKESALYTIQNGAHNFKASFKAAMPAMIKNTPRAKKVASYVAEGFYSDHEGAYIFKKVYCARCHGVDGRGKTNLAPNIREFDEEIIAQILRNGKVGVIGKMPKFDNLHPTQIKALSAYIMSLNEK